MSETTFLVGLGKRVKELRLKSGLTQHQLAIKCNFEKASMSRIESGKTNITVLTLRKICEALGSHMKDYFDF